MKGEAPSYTRWTAAEYRKVAQHALKHLDEGVHAVDAFAKAQRTALAIGRHRTPMQLAKLHASDPPRWQRYIDEAREGAPVKVAKLVKAKAKVKRHRVASWTMREKALVARYIKGLWDLGDNRALASQVLDAQADVLPEDRRYAANTVYTNVSSGKMTRDLQDGLNHVWMLDAADERSQAVEPAHVTVVAKPPAAAPVAPSPHMDGPARAFAADLTAAIDRLLSSHGAHVLSALDRRLAEVVGDMGNTIAEQIKRGLQKTVIDTMAQELGGPLSPKPEPLPDAANDPAPQALAPAPALLHQGLCLKVDVVGLLGSQAAEVRRAFNGTTDLRFIEAEHVSGWTPRTGAEVILTKFTGPIAEHRARKAHVKPLRIKGGAPAIVHAIEALHQSHGIPR